MGWRFDFDGVSKAFFRSLLGAGQRELLTPGRPVNEIHLKPGRERSLRRRHPWIFSGAVGDVRGDPAPGETVEVLSAEGEWLARAAFSPRSQILGRVWTWESGEEVGE